MNKWVSHLNDKEDHTVKLQPQRSNSSSLFTKRNRIHHFHCCCRLPMILYPRTSLNQLSQIHISLKPCPIGCFIFLYLGPKRTYLVDKVSENWSLVLHSFMNDENKRKWIQCVIKEELSPGGWQSFWGHSDCDNYDDVDKRQCSKGVRTVLVIIWYPEWEPWYSKRTLGKN